MLPIVAAVDFHNLVTCTLQDLFSAFLMFWIAIHTGPLFIILSEGPELPA
jgi:hypothetical protein